METISLEDFEKVDIRVGTILQVFDFPKARKAAYQLEIDFGDFGLKKSSAQITNLYNKDELVGRQIIAVINFSPKQIANFYSECLVLGVVGEDKVITLLNPEREVKNGMKIA